MSIPITDAFSEVMRSEGVVLRRWRADDFDFYSRYLGEATTARFYGGVLDKQQAWRHLASLIGHWTLRGFGVYAVEDAAGSQQLGCVGLWEPHGWPCREFVYWFTPAAYRGGQAAAAVRLAIGQVRSRFPGQALTGFIHPANEAALSLARTMGATLEGEVPLLEFGPHVKVSFCKGVGDEARLILQ